MTTTPGKQVKHFISSLYLRDVIASTCDKQFNKTKIENYFKQYSNIRILYFTGVDLNAEKLKIALDSIKHVNFYYLQLDYNLTRLCKKAQFQDSDTEVIKIIGNYLKDTKAKKGQIDLPENFGDHAAKILFPYFKESKIKKIYFSNNAKLSNETVQLYNSISQRMVYLNRVYNHWRKVKDYSNSTKNK